MKLHYTYCKNDSYRILEFITDRYPVTFYVGDELIIEYGWSHTDWIKMYCTPELKVADTCGKHNRKITP